jgi:HD-GYP domain-containing protein (c-di-GMP phosphodiesterase class II)
MLENLDTALKDSFDLLHVSNERRRKATELLEQLKKKSPFKYSHSINCALLSIPAADCFGILRNKMFFSALLHDIGNLETPEEILNKKEGFDDFDNQIIRKHPLDTFTILYFENFKFAAGVGHYHHNYQDEGYPNSNLPLNGYSDATHYEMQYCAKILSILDAYQAMTSRDNDKFGKIIPPSKTKEKVILLRHGQKDMIMKLYQKEVLGK